MPHEPLPAAAVPRSERDRLRALALAALGYYRYGPQGQALSNALTPAVVLSLLDALDAGDRQHQQDQGWTKNDQQQAPEPSRDATDADRLATLADYVDGGDLKIYHHSWLAKPHDPESGLTVVYVESGSRRFEGEPGDSVFVAFCNTLDAMNRGAET